MHPQPPNPQRLFTSTPALQHPVPRQTAPCPLVTPFTPLSLPNRAISLLISDPIGPAPEPSWLSQAQCPGVDSRPFSSHPCCHQIRPASDSLLLLLPQPGMPFLTVLSSLFPSCPTPALQQGMHAAFRARPGQMVRVPKTLHGQDLRAWRRVDSPETAIPSLRNMQ